MIEMLVVIAVIGILAATVLTSLGPARSKAKDTRIKSALNQARAIAETIYDGDYGSLPGTAATIEDVSLTDTVLGDMATEIDSNNGDLQLFKSADEQDYAMWSVLNDGSTYHCVDSSGDSVEVTTEPTSESCS